MGLFLEWLKAQLLDGVSELIKQTFSVSPVWRLRVPRLPRLPSVGLEPGGGCTKVPHISGWMRKCL